MSGDRMAAYVPPATDGTVPYRCVICEGEGRVFRMTDVFRVRAESAMGNSFGWSGPTHEWRPCNGCNGSGVLWR